jgi:hypothetical protein
MIGDLPDEVIIHCLAYLNTKNVIRFVQTNKRYTAIYYNNISILKNIFNNAMFYIFPKDMNLYKIIKDIWYIKNDWKNNIETLYMSFNANFKQICELFVLNQNYCFYNEDIGDIYETFHIFYPYSILIAACTIGHIKVVKYIISKTYLGPIWMEILYGENINLPYNDGYLDISQYTTICIKNNHLDIIKYFNENLRNFNPYDAFDYAIQYDNVDIMIYMMSSINENINNIHHASYYIDNFNGAVPYNNPKSKLKMCISFNAPKCLKYFVEKNDINLNLGVFLAFEKNQTKLANYLITRSDKSYYHDTNLVTYIKNDDVNKIRTLHKIEILPKHVFVAAIYYNSFKIVKFYFDAYNLNLNFLSPEENPLKFAVVNNNYHMVVYLVDKGLVIDSGSIVLHAKNQKFDCNSSESIKLSIDEYNLIIDYLVLRGFNINAYNKIFLQTAISSYYPIDVIEHLIKNGIVVDKEMHYEYAKILKRFDVVELLGLNLVM